MLLPLTLICKKAKARRDGTSVIKIQYCHTSDRRVELDTQVAIPPKYWDRRSHRIAEDLPAAYGYAKELNGKLQGMFRTAEDIVTFSLMNDITDPLAFVKKTFKPGFDVSTLHSEADSIIKRTQTNTDVFFQLDEFITQKRKKVSLQSLRTFENVRECLKAYEQYNNEPLTFQSFDINFGDSFIDFLTYEYSLRRFTKNPVKGLKHNSIKTYINSLRCFLNKSIRKGVTGPVDLSTLKAPGEEVDAIYLSWEEISQIYHADLTGHPLLMVTRDILVLGCLTGMRFSDYSRISPLNIKERFLQKKQQKTDGWVFVPLRPEAKAILDRFGGTIPNICNGDFNERARIVGKMAGLTEKVRFSYKKGTKTIAVIKPKHDWISSHTARRSFCTNEFLAGTPVELIMKMSGHKSLSHFYKYIRISAEEAGRKVMAIWEERGQLLNVPSPKSQQVEAS